MPETVPQPGDVVWIRGRRWRVAAARRDRRVTRLDVANHEQRLTFLQPFDHVVAGVRSERWRRVRPQQALARLAHATGRSFGPRTIASAIDADAAILPHQLEPALAVLKGHRRVLIADEVGLGKTVQAGLIAAEALRRNPAARLLLIVPAALLSQWMGELRRRFGIDALVADRAGLDARARSGAFGETPWRTTGVWIASLDFLKQPHVLDGMPGWPWDLVVIDEAHGACGRSDRHAVADRLARRARRVVLLTATPHSGDEERFERLIRIGRLADDELVVFRRTRADIGVTRRRRVAWHGVALSEAEGRVLAALATFERVVLRAAGAPGRDAARLLLAVFRKRALSTMGALAASIDRRLAWLERDGAAETDAWAQPRLNFGGDVEEDLASMEDSEGLRARTGLPEAAERSWLKRLAHLSAAAARVESKVARLVGLLCRIHEPVVVFTEFRRSLEVLAGRLQLARPLAILHGGLSSTERADALDRFEQGGASALLATDVAGQGLNLHARCRWVVSLELPWNPARLEQRVGRVDRIGQLRPVHLTLLVARHETETDLVAHLARRVRAARRSFGVSALIDIPPNEDAIRRAMIDRVPIAPPGAAPTLALCRAWTRAARAAARHLEAQRALARRWRGPDMAGRPACSALNRHPAIAALAGGGSVLVFSVPLRDHAGALVARHVVAVRGADLEHARRLAVAAVSGRAARAARLTHAFGDAAIALDRRLVAAAQAAAGPFETQPGLFDGRGLRAFEAARAASDDLAGEVETDAARAHRRARIDIGRPVLEVVLLAGRS